MLESEPFSQLLALTAHLLGLHLAPTFHDVPAPIPGIAIQVYIQGQVACDPLRQSALSGSHEEEEAQRLAFQVEHLESLIVLSVQP